MNEANIKQIIEMQSENYVNRIGTTFGTFRIDDVRYNWQAHTQEWVVSCIKCGHTETVTKSVGWDWLRGKGRSRDKCKHCVEIKRETEKNLKIEKREKVKIREELGISQQMIAYRMKKMGMTFEEAISTPKVTMGRPRKQGVPA